MATTVTDVNLYSSGWAVNVVSDDMTAGYVVKDAPGLGYRYRILEAWFNQQASTTKGYQLGAGLTLGVLDAVLIGPVYVATSGARYKQIEPRKPMELPENTALALLQFSGTATSICVFIEGETVPV